mgnify:CR=1 FL=1
MAAKPVLNSKALKLLEEYSASEGITPSEAVIRLVPKKKPLNAKALIKRAEQMSEAEADAILKRASTRKPAMSDAEAAKFAREAVRKYRAEKRAR